MYHMFIATLCADSSIFVRSSFVDYELRNFMTSVAYFEMWQGMGPYVHFILSYVHFKKYYLHLKLLDLIKAASCMQYSVVFYKDWSATTFWLKQAEGPLFCVTIRCAY